MKTKGTDDFIAVRVTQIRHITEKAVEIRLSRPEGFEFLPGQKISILHNELSRDYTLIGSQKDRELSICLRNIPNGLLSPILANAAVGDRFHISRAFGHFLFQSHGEAPVFVATGTGVAPFVAYVRDGVTGYHLLHGVTSEDELYYRGLLSQSASSYTPCISHSGDAHKTPYYHGRVTDFLTSQLSLKPWDFYLCGHGEMIREVIRIIDRCFDGSRVFTEVFY